MKKFYWLFIFLVIIFITIFFFRSFTKEDIWICQNGAWVKHGNPKVDKPTTGCNNNPDQFLEVKNNDGKIVTDDFEINLPYGWIKMEKPMPGITLMVVNDNEQPNDENTKKINFRSYYAITYVSWEKDLNDYLPVYENELKSVASGAIIENINDGNVNDQQAKFFDTKISQQNINFKAFVAIVRGNNNDIWIFTFNTTESLWNNYQNFIPEILNTFKVKK